MTTSQGKLEARGKQEAGTQVGGHEAEGEEEEGYLLSPDTKVMEL